MWDGDRRAAIACDKGKVDSLVLGVILGVCTCLLQNLDSVSVKIEDIMIICDPCCVQLFMSCQYGGSFIDEVSLYF